MEEKNTAIKQPQLELPTGGGALKGIGEQFNVNAVTGTAAFTIPLPVAQNRHDFVPHLSLSYDSGRGNGVFGMGWGVNLPYIARKTQKRLPRYDDEHDCDQFYHSGSDDLVYDPDGDTGTDVYRIYRYYPRIVHSFQKIERWVHKATGRAHWRVIAGDNTTHIYGDVDTACIHHPGMTNGIYKWYLTKSYDGYGNIIEYTYKQENTERISPERMYEKQRLDAMTAFNNVYLKRVTYGNALPYEGQTSPGDANILGNTRRHFHLLFDYGEHTEDNPTPDEVRPWNVRMDAFSDFKPGFDLRTYRLCKRVILFHHFDELGDVPRPVRSLELTYDEQNAFTLLQSVLIRGYKHDHDQVVTKSEPPVEFTYTSDRITTDLKEVDAASMENLPMGISGFYQFVDLDTCGLNGILCEQGGGWYYKSNRGEARFAPAVPVMDKPALSSRGTARIVDIDGDGNKELVIYDANTPGYYAYEDRTWKEFRHFTGIPGRDLDEGKGLMLDLTGDGLPDLVLTDDDALVYYPSLGKSGYDAPVLISSPTAGRDGPRLLYAGQWDAVFLADMTGDGLTDIVRVSNDGVCYWANSGYGVFSHKIVMDNAVRFDHPDCFDTKRIRLADINGCGTADIVYANHEQITVLFNQAGNSWSEPLHITHAPLDHGAASFHITDLMGTGTACLVFSDTGEGRIRYMDLLNSNKPFLLETVTNNRGTMQRFTYAPSTRFYLDDKAANTPWITTLHFPVQVVEKVEIIDFIAGSRFVTRYAYHHGYYDEIEREFHGFGMVEQWDSETYEEYLEAPGTDETLYVSPVYTKTWFHTGAYIRERAIREHYRKEFYQNPLENSMHTRDMITDAGILDGDELRQAHRALKGKVLRSEVYAHDDRPDSNLPYMVNTHTYMVKHILRKKDERQVVFFTTQQTGATYNYERNPLDPRVSEEVVLELDDYGNITRRCIVFYPRFISGDCAEQSERKLMVECATYANITTNGYRLGIPLEQQSFEVKGMSPGIGIYFSFNELRAGIEQALEPGNQQPYYISLTGITVQSRIISWKRLYYSNENTGTPLPFGTTTIGALLHHEETAVYHVDGMGEHFSGIDIAGDTGFILQNDYYWCPGLATTYGTPFYLPVALTSPAGGVTRIEYDKNMVMETITNALGDRVTVDIDWYTLTPSRLIDVNGNTNEVVCDPLGRVIAMSRYGTEEGSVKGDAALDEYSPLSPQNLDAVVADPAAYLQQASKYFYYDDAAWMERGEPLQSLTLSRATYVSDRDGDADDDIRISIVYSDGMGTVIQEKARVETGPAFARDAQGSLIFDPHNHLVVEDIDERWLVSGRSVYNNKNKPVKKYEPFYSSTHRFEQEEELGHYGVTPVITYDPLLREVRVDRPDGFFTRVEFDPWRSRTYDENDTIKQSVYYDENGELKPDTGLSGIQVEALTRSEHHDLTYTTALFDACGNTVMSIERLTTRLEREPRLLVTRSTLDIMGNILTLTDPRQYELNESRGANQRIVNFRYTYDMTGNVLIIESVDNGITRQLYNYNNDAVHQWDGNGNHRRNHYDALFRLTDVVVTTVNGTRTVEKMIYGETVTGEGEAASRNVRGRMIRHYDQAGLTCIDRYDIDGNIRSRSRRFTSDYKAAPDWMQEDTALLDAPVYSHEYTYTVDGALLTEVLPDTSNIRRGYHRSGRLNAVWLHTVNDAGEHPVCERINYNARGQRMDILYGNGIRTEYTYDRYTFRLASLISRSVSDGKVFQDIDYTYDPVGNLLMVNDRSHETVFSNNHIIDPASRYVYDSLYRLLEASGREHTALTGDGPQGNAGRGDHFIDLSGGSNINDANALSSYTRAYSYDTGGNLTEIKHQSPDSSRSFTRSIMVAESANRAVLDTGDYSHFPEEHFDENGNQLAVDGVAYIEWDYRNMPRKAGIVVREDTVDDVEYYVYDSTGNRVRKVTETLKNGGTMIEVVETMYLSSMNIKRIYRRSADTTHLIMERYMIPVMDDARRIAHTYYWTVDELGRETTSLDQYPIHYQLDNHLNSVALELDHDRNLISYEEYYPYGGTAFIAGHGTTGGMRLKVYRYTGKELDEATGLYYYGKRYYISWMGRFLSCDPAGTIDGPNLYAYVSGNPIRYNDPTGTDEKDAMMHQNIYAGFATFNWDWENMPTYGFSMLWQQGLSAEYQVKTGMSFSGDDPQEVYGQFGWNPFAYSPEEDVPSAIPDASVTGKLFYKIPDYYLGLKATGNSEYYGTYVENGLFFNDFAYNFELGLMIYSIDVMSVGYFPHDDTWIRLKAFDPSMFDSFSAPESDSGQEAQQDDTPLWLREPPPLPDTPVESFFKGLGSGLKSDEVKKYIPMFMKLVLPDEYAPHFGTALEGLNINGQIDFNRKPEKWHDINLRLHESLIINQYFFPPPPY